MAKPLGPKSQLIRQAITDNRDKGNKEIAELLNDAEERMDDKIKVTPNDVAQQRQAMKKAGAQPTPEPAAKPERKKPGRKPRGISAHGRTASTSSHGVAPTGAVDLIDRTIELAKQAGGVSALKRLVDRLAEMQGG